MGLFKCFVMNDKVFRNLFCNPQKSFHTSPTRIIEAVNQSSNSTIAFTKKKKKIHLAVIFLVNAIVEFEKWLTISIIREEDSGRKIREEDTPLRKITERCENSFVDYRINYQKLCYLMRQIMKDLNSPSVYRTVTTSRTRHWVSIYIYYLGVVIGICVLCT